MNCKKVKFLLIDYAETRAEQRNSRLSNMVRIIFDPITKVRERLIQRHLRRCAACRKELEHIEKVRQQLRLMHAPELTEDEWNSFQEKLSSILAQIEQPPLRRRSSAPSLVLAGAGAVFVLLLLTVLTRQLRVGPIENGSSLAKNRIHSALQDRAKLGSDAEDNQATESYFADMTGLSAEEIDELVYDVASLSDEEWRELLDSVTDSTVVGWDVEDEVDALSLEECNEVLERLEST